MRGIIRKSFKIDTWFWIIALASFVMVLYVTFGLPNVDAISRADFEELKDQKAIAVQEIKDIDDKIQDKKDDIESQEISIKDMRDELRKFEAGADWESIKQKLGLEDEINDAARILSEYKSGLDDLFNEKNDLVKILDSLSDRIDNAELDRPTDLSHLDTKIGIALSKSCETMIKNNFETNCPTYKQLVQLDSSDTDISGKFTTTDGFFHRGDEIVKNSYKFYWNDKQIRIFVDPPGDMTERIKMIYIQPNFDTYTVAGDMTIHDEFRIINDNRTETIGNKTRLIEFENRTQTEFFGTVLYHDRYIDKCKTATINANNWKFLIGDTIHLMRNECDRGFTAFEEREVILPEYSKIDITTSPNWIYQQWLKHTEEFCIFKYKQYQ